MLEKIINIGYCQPHKYEYMQYKYNIILQCQMMRRKMHSRHLLPILGYIR